MNTLTPPARLQRRPAARPAARGLLVATAAALALLAGCDNADDGRTVGQRTDDAAAQTERAAERAGDKAATEARETGRDIREAGRDAQQAAGKAADAVGDKTRDVAITAEVNMRLARDDRLSALGINVDTVDGQVVLRGSAPDTASRNRAAELVKGIDGVREVRNELTVQPKP